MYQQSKKIIFFFGILILLFFVIVLPLTSCQPLDSNEVVNDLLPNVWVLLTHILASVFLLIIAMWLIWKPTNKSLEKRRQYIANEIAEAEKSRREAFEQLQKAEQTKIAAHLHANAIIENATNQAYAEKERIEGESKINAKKIVQDAEIHAARLKHEIRKNNEKQIIDVAFSVAEALIQKKVNRKNDNKMLKELIKTISKEKDEMV